MVAAEQKDGIRLFVYALCEPDGKTVRYVGVTANLWKRLHGHYSHPCIAKVREWIFTLRSAGLVPAMIVLREVVGVEAGMAAEADEIRRHANAPGSQLLNEQGTGHRNKTYRTGLVEFGGRKMTLSRWAKHLGISRQALNIRLMKYPVEVALSATKQKGVAIVEGVSMPRFNCGVESVVVPVVESLVKKTGLDHTQRRERRRLIANAVEKGAAPSQVAAAYEVTVTSVYSAMREFESSAS